MNGPDDQSGPKSDACFTTTHWSAVLAAGQQDLPQATAALEALCRSYWYPLYAYAWRRGYGPEDAQDLTQLLRKNYPARADRAKGRFRTFLLQSQLSYPEAAVRLGVSESAVKSMIHRLRQRHRELVREEIAHTVPTVAEIDEELRHLVAVLRG